MNFLSGQDDFFRTGNQPISVRHLSQPYNKSIYLGPNVTESTTRDPETTPEQEGGSQGPQGAPDSIEEKGVTGNKQSDITGRKNDLEIN